MPNYVATTLTIKGTKEQVDDIKRFIRNEQSGAAIDFDKIIPMPETFRKYDTTNYPNGDHLRIGERAGLYSLIVTPELIEEYKAATREQEEKYGVVGWYDWSRRNWGTKWNACEPAVDRFMPNLIYFKTAWNFAAPVVLALSEIFPEVQFEFVYADEDAGYNTGRGIAQGGEFIEEEHPEGGSDAGMELYFATHPGNEDNWAKDEKGEWKYICDY